MVFQEEKDLGGRFGVNIWGIVAGQVLDDGEKSTTLDVFNNKWMLYLGLWISSETLALQWES